MSMFKSTKYTTVYLTKTYFIKVRIIIENTE